MPDRVIRDELLRSRRYRRLSSDTARVLFFHLLLTVDALGNMEADDISIEDALHRDINAETAAKLLAELADADLIRLYQIDAKPYLHIPRFRQRLRYVKRTHPRPPAEIECNEIKQLIGKVGPETDFRPSKDRRAPLEVKRSEVKRSEVTPHAREAESNTRQHLAAQQNQGGDFPKGQTTRPKPVPQIDDTAGLDCMAREYGLSCTPYETYADLRNKIFAERRKRGEIA